jgi:hypothetical protein
VAVGESNRGAEAAVVFLEVVGRVANGRVAGDAEVEGVKWRRADPAQARAEGVRDATPFEERGGVVA